jgi:quaternary ammonium compound-resistance protein SugE
MAWFILIIAGLFEVAWAVGLKYTHGFTRLWPSLGTGVCMVASFLLLSQSLKTIPIGTAYAVWTGIGAAGTALVGILWLHEPRDLPRMLCLGLIIAGVAGLKWFSPSVA